MPISSNPKRASPIEILTGKSPSLVDIIALGLSVTCFVIPKEIHSSSAPRLELLLGRAMKRKVFAFEFHVIAMSSLHDTSVKSRLLLMRPPAEGRIASRERFSIEVINHIIFISETIEMPMKGETASLNDH